MYESHYTHHFFRLWGVTEGRSGGINPDNLLLGNSQNNFDAKFGDVAAKAGNRYFLIEFKRERDGIAAEVTDNTKLYRKRFYDHIKGPKNATCRHLAYRGHYAAYPDDDLLHFEPYLHAAAKRVYMAGGAATFDRTPFNPDAVDDIGKALKPLPFETFHDAVLRAKQSVDSTAPALGLSRDEFRAYIDCMYPFFNEQTNEDGETIMGIVNPKTKEFSAFGGTIDGLVRSLHADFAQLKKGMKP